VLVVKEIYKENDILSHTMRAGLY